MKVYKIIISCLKKSKVYIGLFFILSIILNYFVSYIPIVIKYFLDRVLNQNADNIVLDKMINLFGTNINYIISICIVLVFVELIVVLATYFRSIIKSKIIQEFQCRLTLKLFNHIQSLTYEEFYSNSLAELIQNSNNDVDNIVKFVDTQITYILDIVLIVIFAIVNLITIDIRLASVMIILSVIIVYISKKYCEYSFVVIGKKIEMDKKLFTKMNDNFENIKFLKLCNRQEKEIKEFQEILKEGNKANKEKVKIDTNYNMGVEKIVKLGSPFIFLLSAYLYMKNSITIGAIYVALSYSNRVTKSFLDIAEIIEKFNMFRESIDRLDCLLELTLENNKEYNMINIRKRKIIFENVNIYSDCVCILENLNFTIDESEKVLIVGATGSGKTILVKTLIGFYGYTGSIKIGEYELRKLSKADIRENICLLLQDSYIFSKTIAENIKILVPYMSNDNMVDLSKFFTFDDEVRKFKDGYNSKIGKKGLALSKGQRQRLVLVRAFTKPKPIMIFDDSFSAIDRINKKRILDNLLNMKEDFTKIVISHDTLLSEKFDKIIYVKDKHVLVGTYEELMKDKDFLNVYNLSKNKLEEE